MHTKPLEYDGLGHITCLLLGRKASKSCWKIRTQGAAYFAGKPTWEFWTTVNVVLQPLCSYQCEASGWGRDYSREIDWEGLSSWKTKRNWKWVTCHLANTQKSLETNDLSLSSKHQHNVSNRKVWKSFFYFWYIWGINLFVWCLKGIWNQQWRHLSFRNMMMSGASIRH